MGHVLLTVKYAVYRFGYNSSNSYLDQDKCGSTLKASTEGHEN